MNSEYQENWCALAYQMVLIHHANRASNVRFKMPSLGLRTTF